MDEMSPRLQHFLCVLGRGRMKTVENLRCVDRAWPSGLRISEIGWDIRTRNCLQREGLLKDTDRLLTLRFNELFLISGIGISGMLDFASTLECAIDTCCSYTANQPSTDVANTVDRIPLDSSTTQSGSTPKRADPSTSDVMASINSTLEQFANEHWATQISDQDPRFRSLLPPGQGTIRERIEGLTRAERTIENVSHVRSLAESLTDIEQTINGFRERTLEENLSEFLWFIAGDWRRADILAARWGCHGGPTCTLDECGRRAGITREGVRQIEVKALIKLPQHDIFAPRLEDALRILSDHVPLTIEQASNVLLSSGITRGKFNVKSLLRTAKILRKTTHLAIYPTAAGDVLITPSNAALVKHILSVARKLAGQSGVSGVFAVQDALEESGALVEEAYVRRILGINHNFQFLDEDWFWAADIPAPRNRLRNVARKILSVVSPQTVLSIRDGVRNAYRGRSLADKRYATLVVPPLRIIEGFIRAHPEFAIKDGLVHPCSTLDYRKELKGTELVMVNVLRHAPAGILDRRSFLEACMTRGMNENTFGVYSTYSCVLEHMGLNIWKLRGTNVDPASVEALRIANHFTPREKRMLDYGWTKDRMLRIAVSVPRTGRGSLVVGCPGAVKRYLVGRKFVAKTKRGQPCGNVSINEQGSSFGYGPFIRRFGLDENDVLVADFDLFTNEVTLDVGDESALE